MGANKTVPRRGGKGFEGGILSKNDDGEEWARRILENGSNGGEVNGVLEDGVVELVFGLAEIEYLGPEFTFCVAVNPAGIIF